jgi:hypothetical protein
MQIQILGLLAKQIIFVIYSRKANRNSLKPNNLVYHSRIL